MSDDYAPAGPAVAIKESDSEPRYLVPVSRVGTFVAYALLLRVSILVATTLFFFPIAALGFSLFKPLFENFFVLEFWPTWVTSLVALMVAWSLVLSVLVVLFNAPDRFGVPAVLSQDIVRDHEGFTRAVIGASTLFLAAPTLLGQFVHFGWNWANAFAVVGGAVNAYVLAYASLLGVLYVLPSAITFAVDIFPAPKRLRGWLRRARDANSKWTPRWQSLGTWLARLPRDLAIGIIDERKTFESGKDNPAYGLPWSGVLLAIMFGIATFVVYYVIGYGHDYTTGTRVPALAFVLLLLLNFHWLFGFATYVLDRFRVPLLLILLLSAIVSDSVTNYSEHYYRLEDRDPATATIAQPHPADVIAALQTSGRPIVVVSTMGGGIQAAAWTAKVLTGLQEKLQQDLPQITAVPGRTFADSIALVSSVSGGAHGSLFFLSQYQPADGARVAGFSPSDDFCTERQAGLCTNYNKLFDKVVEPRLDDVAWALVYRDVPRILFPYAPRSYSLLFPKSVPDGPFLDRGLMLELSWKRAGLKGKLSDWQAGLREGWRPASVFNATIAETGEPFRLSTTEFSNAYSPARNSNPPGTDASLRPPRPMTFAQLYPQADIDLVTATRLASGFPYVLPIPRALRSKDADNRSKVNSRFKYHLIDGGYYDNYGVNTAVQWVDDALTEMTNADRPLPPAILFLQIRAFPDIRLPDMDHPPSPMSGDYEKKLPKDRGWFYEIYSPIDGLLHVRAAGQLLHDRDELLLLRSKWQADGRGRGGTQIRFATFEFQGKDTPLSFKMNDGQKAEITKEWDAYAVGQNDDLAQVKCLFDRSRPGCDRIVLLDPK